MICNTELFDAIRIQGIFYPGSGVWGWKNGKIHNYTRANGNLVLMWGGGGNLSCDLDLLHFFVFKGEGCSSWIGGREPEPASNVFDFDSDE
jgi:hypothetical protein